MVVPDSRRHIFGRLCWWRPCRVEPWPPCHFRGFWWVSGRFMAFTGAAGTSNVSARGDSVRPGRAHSSEGPIFQTLVAGRADEGRRQVPIFYAKQAEISCMAFHINDALGLREPCDAAMPLTKKVLLSHIVWGEGVGIFIPPRAERIVNGSLVALAVFVALACCAFIRHVTPEETYYSGSWGRWFSAIMLSLIAGAIAGGSVYSLLRQLRRRRAVSSPAHRDRDRDRPHTPAQCGMELWPVGGDCSGGLRRIEESACRHRTNQGDSLWSSPQASMRAPRLGGPSSEHSAQDSDAVESHAAGAPFNADSSWQFSAGSSLKSALAGSARQVGFVESGKRIHWRWRPRAGSRGRLVAVSGWRWFFGDAVGFPVAGADLQDGADHGADHVVEKPEPSTAKMIRGRWSAVDVTGEDLRTVLSRSSVWPLKDSKSWVPTKCLQAACMGGRSSSR